MTPRLVSLALLWWGGAAFAQDASTDPAPATDPPSATDEGAPVASPEASAPASAPDPDLDALRAEIAALRDAVAAQQARLSEAETRLRSQQRTLAETKLRVDKKPDLKFDVEGYYRLRGHVFGVNGKTGATGGLYLDQPTSGTFMNQRVRLQLNAVYKEGLAKLHVGVQALDNVLWGDNISKSRTALFAEDPSNTRRDLSEAPPFELFRAWTEIRLPIGQIRAGRMSSHWGLGLLANDGDGFDDDFGENYFGNQFDRVLFATNPVSIAQAITKKQESKEIPLIVAVGVDRLVEDPLVEYFGVRCTPGADRDSPGWDLRCDTDGDGITDADNGFTENRDSGQRGVDWWANARDDVWEMLYVLMYRGENVRYFGGVGDLTAGAYVIHRLQRETDSDVVVGDIYLDAKVHGVSLAFEGLGIWGGTRALTLPNSLEPEDPLFKRAAVYGYVARLAYEQERWKVLFESGYASGDDNVNDGVFTGRPLHPDHNAGLLLYEEVIARVTEASWTGDASSLRSKGGVYNSHYIFPRISGVPFQNWQIIGGFLMAWPDRPDGAVFRCSARDASNPKLSCTEGGEDIKGPLGWEVDLAVKHRWFDHLLFSLEMGYARATNRLPLERTGLNPEGNFFTLQSRLAWEF